MALCKTSWRGFGDGWWKAIAVVEKFIKEVVRTCPLWHHSGGRDSPEGCDRLNRTWQLTQGSGIFS